MNISCITFVFCCRIKLWLYRGLFEFPDSRCHMFQWHTTESDARDCGIRFCGSRAREYAEGNFFFAPSSRFPEIAEYELDANRVCLGILDAIMGRTEERSRV